MYKRYNRKGNVGLRKGQMEILGLAVLFIIVIVAFLLFLRLGSDDANTPFEDYYQKTLSHDLLMTITATSFDCDGVTYSISDLLTDYKSKYGNNIMCKVGETAKNSGGILKLVGDEIVGASLQKVGRRYWFAIWNDTVLNEYGLVDPSKADKIEYLNQSKNTKGKINCNMFDYNQKGMAQITLIQSYTYNPIYIGIGICR